MLYYLFPRNSWLRAWCSFLKITRMKYIFPLHSLSPIYSVLQIFLWKNTVQEGFKKGIWWLCIRIFQYIHFSKDHLMILISPGCSWGPQKSVILWDVTSSFSLYLPLMVEKRLKKSHFLKKFLMNFHERFSRFTLL